jgi:NMD protein affecting ribosome stability and mRNA decay
MQIKRDKLIKERRHDTYRLRGKLSEPTLCSECGSSFVKGRWTWEPAPEDTAKTICPACRRIAENFPAGFIEVKGAFYAFHRDEVRNLIRNIEKLEKERHPLERIIAVREEEDIVRVATTGVHIARRIGEALSRAYQGALSFQYADGAKIIRVFWER